MEAFELINPLNNPYTALTVLFGILGLGITGGVIWGLFFIPKEAETDPQTKKVQVQQVNQTEGVTNA